MDALVKSAIAHWAPRFVANGVALTDFEEVTARSRRGTTGAPRGPSKAAVHEAMGREALANKKFSARASTCSAPASITTSASSCSCTTCRR